MNTHLIGTNLLHGIHINSIDVQPLQLFSNPSSSILQVDGYPFPDVRDRPVGTRRKIGIWTSNVEREECYGHHDKKDNYTRRVWAKRVIEL